MSCVRPPAKQQNNSSPISMLKDNDLEQIFKWLPPFDRLIAAEVCRRWHGIARTSWLDVKRLDLSPIPGKHVNAVLKQCPNVKSIFAADRSFRSRELSYLGKHPSPSIIKLYSCNCTVEIHDSGIIPGVFSEKFQQSSCTEFIMHDAFFHVRGKQPLGSLPPSLEIHAGHLPASLTHLQLSNLRLDARFFNENLALLHFGLQRLENLECLILLDVTTQILDASAGIARPVSLAFHQIGVQREDIFTQICCLKNLKELCIGSPVSLHPDELDDLIQCLPKLQVLFIHGLHILTTPAEYNMRTIASSASLRILVLIGGITFKPVAFPVRKKYPNGFGEDPQPPLHVFVGNGPSMSIRFAKSEMNAAIVHPINQPFPQFIQRADIAQIFDGVWIAERIKDSEHYSGQLWDFVRFDLRVRAFNV